MPKSTPGFALRIASTLASHTDSGSSFRATSEEISTTAETPVCATWPAASACSSAEPDAADDATTGTRPAARATTRADSSSRSSWLRSYISLDSATANRPAEPSSMSQSVYASSASQSMERFSLKGVSITGQAPVGSVESLIPSALR